MNPEELVRMHALKAATTYAADNKYKLTTVIKLADAFVGYIKTGEFHYEYAPRSHDNDRDTRYPRRQ